MIGKILILAALALIEARPSDEPSRPSLFSSLWEPSELCPPTHNHFLLPHEWDCTKYYYCEYGMKYIAYRSCAPGTVFSTYTQVCVHPRDYNCELPGYPPTDAPTPSPTPAPTQPPATEPPVTEPPTTETPVTEPQTTEPPTTEPPATEPPTTEPPATEPPATEPPVTEPPTTEPPATEPPVTDPPTTEPPATEPPTTEPPATEPPTTEPPTTEPPVTEPPTTEPPATDPPTTEPPVTEPPTTEPPKTEPPATEPPATEPPATEPPVTEPPATEAPATESPTQAPPGLLPNGCPADFNSHHLLPHAECNKFYYCVFGETVERQCAPGTYFNYKIQVCDWPHNVECASNPTPAPTQAPATEPPATESPATEPPVTEPPVTEPPTTEPPTTEPPATEPLTTEPPTTEPPATEPPTTEPPTTEPPKTEPPTTEPPTTEPPTTEPPTTEPPATEPPATEPPLTEPPATEPPATEPPTTEPPTTEPPATEPPATEPPSTEPPATEPPATEPPATEPPATEPPATEPPATELPVTEPPATEPPVTEAPATEAPPGVLANGCPADFDVHHLLPHAECNKFYYCVFGETVERQCAPGTYFNYKIQTCDWPHNVECASTGGENGGGENGGGENGGENGEDENSTGEVDIGGFLENGCPANFSIHHLLPHETSCNKFYYCVDGEKVESQCAAGTHFNPANQECDWPENVGCINEGGDGDGEDENGSGDNGDNEVEILPNGCPADGDIHLLLPHEDCDKFYSCVHGNKVEVYCPLGTHFNPSIQACDWPANAGCAVAGGEESGENGGNENGGTENDRCKNNCNVLPWAHDTDCDKFWRCDGENKVLSVCSEGLHFNPSTWTCDFICNAGCVREKAQATMSASGIKLFLPWDKVDSEMERLIELSIHET